MISLKNPDGSLASAAPFGAGAACCGALMLRCVLHLMD